jgi:hypothetical protein
MTNICPRCETLPQKLPETGVIYFIPPIIPVYYIIWNTAAGIGLSSKKTDKIFFQ